MVLIHTYTNPLGKLIVPRITRSIKSEMTIIAELKRTSLSYFCSPLLTRFSFTVRIKYTLRKASMKR